MAETEGETEAPSQQFVVHVFIHVKDGEQAYEQLLAIWQRCGSVLGMTSAIPTLGLPTTLPQSLAALLATTPDDQETPIAAIERPDADDQAIVRRRDDALCFSATFTPGSWQRAEADWRDLTRGTDTSQSGRAAMLGEARLRLELVDDDQPPRDSAAFSTHPDGFAIAETTAPGDAGILRNLRITARRADDPLLSRWVWSRGDAAMPRLARYLLQVAKLRRIQRDWRRYRVELADDPRRLIVEVRQDRLSVERVRDNLVRLLPPEAFGGGPFAADLYLAETLIERFDDELEYLALDVERALLADNGSPRSSATNSPQPGTSVERDPRAVFVAYGRDLEVRKFVFDYLRALDLRPFEWETLVRRTGKSMPTVREAIDLGLATAQAVLVVFTPDDEVRLHARLRNPGEGDGFGMQARANVLVELGMALAVDAERTLILEFGRLRPLSDLMGLNTVRPAESEDWPSKVAERLDAAGCPVDRGGQDWLAAGRDTSLAAYTRRPDVPGAIAAP